MNNIIIIKTEEHIDRLVTSLISQKVVFIDTEFFYKNTYYPKLSTIQITCSLKKQYIIDALELDISQIEVFYKQVLCNSNIVKVMHSVDQDLKMFLHLFKMLPKNIFDTQIAYSMLFHENNIGYAKMCKLMLNKNIDKTLQSTDWSRRPLTNEMMKYAILDTHYLDPIYRNMKFEIDGRNLNNNFSHYISNI
ncbi:MAG TPA: ribonuclease D, partial [Candidatus Megaira endosymbiont of Hartmannula sinica]|nr:ribonuclease D [Candidatus Megaera endosymbiont of Hartmannula sinica]